MWGKGEREAAPPARPHVKHTHFLRERGGTCRLLEVGAGSPHLPGKESSSRAWFEDSARGWGV